MSKNESDPVHEERGLWYFWDETWSSRYGPYATEYLCRLSLVEYCENL